MNGYQFVFEVESADKVHILERDVCDHRGELCTEMLCDLVATWPKLFEGRLGAISFGDAPPDQSWAERFELSFCTTKMIGVPAPCLPFPCPHSLRWPDIGVQNSELLLEELLMARSPYKDERIFWIGAETHPTRRALRDLALENPGIFDIELMEWTRGPGNISRSKTRQVSIPEHRDYKYLVDCQGYGYSGRLKWLLASGRPVFVVDRREVEHWHENMKPWVHYIPVSADLSDLLQNYKRVEESPGLYEEIGHNAREFAASHLRLEEQLVRVAEEVAHLASPRQTSNARPQLPQRQTALVVARYREDLSWINAVPETCQVFIINKGKPIDTSIFDQQSPYIVERPNIGRESDTYLNFMEKGWHEGYEWVVFTQGNPFPHSPGFLQLLEKVDQWSDMQPLSCRWFHLPPDTLLEHDDEHWIAGLPIRKELISLHTLDMIRYHDEGHFGMMSRYSAIHGLPPGANLAAHFFQSIGLHDRARQAALFDLGSYSFGAIFGVKTSLINALPPEALTLARRFAQTDGVHGYIFERMWQHIFGEPFLHAKSPQAVAAADLAATERTVIHPVWSGLAEIVADLLSSVHADSFLLFGADRLEFDGLGCSRRVLVNTAVMQPNEMGSPEAGDDATYRLSAEAFFKQNNDSFDVIAAPNPRDANEMRSILYGGWETLNRGGVLLCGNVKPDIPRSPSGSGAKPEVDDRWREWVRFRAAHPKLRMFVVDSKGGIGVILRDAPPGPPLSSFPVTDLTWVNYLRHRKEWLDLLSPIAAKRLYLSVIKKAKEPDVQERAIDGSIEIEDIDNPLADIDREPVMN